MSTNSKILSSTSSTAIAAAAISKVKIVVDDVPSFGPDCGSADADNWHDATGRVAKSSADLEGRSDRASHQTLSMIVQDAELHDAEFYKAKIKSLGLGLPKNQDIITLAIACHLGIDVSHVDKKIKANNSKALNRYVSAARQLRVEAPHNEDGKLAVSFDAEGVAKLMTIIADKGGINALMKIYLDAKKGQTTTDIVALDAEDLAELRLQKLASRIPEDRELIVGLGRRENAKSILMDQEIRLTTALKSAIAAQFSFPAEDVQFLKELLIMGHCVPEVMTDKLVNRFDDPEDRSAPRRLARPHFVFDPSGGVTISPILSDASVMVTVKPSVQLFGKPIQGHMEFRTQQVRSVELNLAGDRADAFDLKVEDAAGTKNGVARLTLSSQAAVKDKDGNSKSINLLMQQVYSKSGVLPLALDTFTPKHTLEVINFLPIMKEIAASCGDAIKNTKPIKVIGGAGGVTFSVGKAEKSLAHSDAPKNFSLNVRADDFLAVSETLADVDITTGITLGLDPEMLVLMFGTKSASYSVYIPMQRTDGKRSNRFMHMLKPQVWPGFVPADGQEVAETDAE